MKNLKITAIVLLNLLAYVLCAQQQTQEEKDGARESRAARHKLVAGLKVGFNNSNVYDSQGQNFVADNKTGFAGGGFLAIPLGSFIGFQPELMFSQKGFHGSGIMSGEPYAVTRTTSYLDIPLQVQFKPVRFLSFLAGVQYSYLLKQSDDYTFGVNSVEQNQQFKNDNIRKNIAGVVLGADLNIRHLVLSARGSWDLVANHGDGTSATPRYKNVVLQLTVGYRFY